MVIFHFDAVSMFIPAAFAFVGLLFAILYGGCWLLEKVLAMSKRGRMYLSKLANRTHR